NRFGTISQLDAMRTGVDYNTAQKAVGLVELSSATIHGRGPAGEICVGFDHHAPAVESSIKNHGLRVSADQLHLFRLAAILQLQGGPFDESPQARIEIRLVIGVDLIVTLDRERLMNNPGTGESGGVAEDFDASVAGENFDLAGEARLPAYAEVDTIHLASANGALHTVYI